MSSTPRRFALRAGAVLTVATAAALATAVPAFAHVTAQSSDAQQGGYTVVNMRVPNESDTAGTVKLEVSLPVDHPITSVRTSPVPGWTATMATSPLNPPLQRNGRTYSEAVTTVTWTATPGTKIGPGQFMDFPLSLGPLPSDTDTLSLPATQTYDNGEVVAWNEPTPADGSEPERPAPTVTLSPSTGEDEHGGHSAAAAPAAPADSDTTARWLGGAGLLVGALGLGLGGGAVLRSRRQSAS